MANPGSASSSLMLDRMSELYCNNLMSDVIFLVGDERTRVPGHKFLVKTEATLEIFLSLSQKQLNEIAELDGLNCEEFELFSAIMTWAQHNCLKLQIPCTPKNLREILGDVLYKIRFPIFSKEEIFEVFAEYRHILTHNEIRDIIQTYKGKDITAYAKVIS
uniref:Uncharacterized protein n=1 Tax=Phlebotomus papatasi TaxID=29031 RepID=A0A1B0DAR9_PHLPP